MDPDYPRISNLVEGFHPEFRTRVNRARPWVQDPEPKDGFGVLPGCSGGAQEQVTTDCSSPLPSISATP